MGLRLRIMSVFLLMSGVSTGIVVAGIVTPLIDQYRKANDELAASSRQAAGLAADYLQDRRDEAEKTVAWLARHEYLTYRNHAEARALFTRLSDAGATQKQFVAIDAKGQVVASSQPVEAKAVAALPLVVSARAEAKPIWSERLAWPGGSDTVAVASRYKYYDREGEHWGVVIAACDMPAWNKALNQQGANVAIYAGTTGRIMPPGDGVVHTHEVAEALAGKSGSRIREADVVAYAPVPRSNWSVVLTKPTAQTLLPINQNIKTAATFGALALLVAGVLSFLLSGFLVAPIRRLEARAAALSKGEWHSADATPVAHGNDELGRLAESFEAMAVQLRDRFESIEAVVAQRTKELERTNNQLTYVIEELKELDELKRSFLDAVSHELRTPLNFIMGYGSGLEDGLFGDMNEEQAHAVLRIMEGSERLLGVINDLIEVSRLQAGQAKLAPQPIELSELLALASEQLAVTHAERGHALHVDIEPGLPPAFADPEAVGQILRQLTSNAAKFTEPGGTVTLRARTAMGKVLVEVADTGCGIAPEALPHIWESFRQGDGSMTRLHGGTGVGLTIVKRLVEAMGQTIEVESRPGCGSTFRFTLPVAELGDELEVTVPKNGVPAV